MARIRTIKPSFFRDQGVADLPLTARLTFIGLWTFVDDEGRGIDDARLVKGDLWPLDEKHTTKKVDADLQLLHDRGLIQRYEVAGRRYLLVTNWKHQKINRPSTSTFPAPITNDSVNGHGAPTDRSRQEGKGKEKEGNREQGSRPSPATTPALAAPPPAPPGRLTRPASFVEIVEPNGQVARRREASAVIESATAQGARLLDSERTKLRPIIEDALANGYDSVALAAAVVAAPFKTAPSVMGELRMRARPSRRSVGDTGLAAAADWLNGLEGA